MLCFNKSEKLNLQVIMLPWMEKKQQYKKWKKKTLIIFRNNSNLFELPVVKAYNEFDQNFIQISKQHDVHWDNQCLWYLRYFG